MLISIDAGKFMTKAVIMENGKFKTFSLRTKIEDYTDAVFNDNKTYMVEFGGKSYLIGEYAMHSDYTTSKTRLVHQLVIYTALGILANGCEIELLTGCPLSQFINVSNRNSYADFILGRKYIQIKINGTSKNFTINKVYVYPESIGVLMLNVGDFTNKLIGIIDIGGLNTNGAIYDNLKPVKNSMFTINEGANILFAKIKRELNVAMGRNYQDYEIPYAIYNPDTKSVIGNILTNQLNTIMEECKRYNWNLDALTLIFTGGGSILLEKQIRDLNNAKLSPNAVWDNAMGFYKLKEMLQ
jgi:hypothetical protein